MTVKAFLYGNDTEALESTTTNIDDNDKLNIEYMSRWRKIGPLGKLHLIVTYINRSPQRRDTFKSMQPHGIPGDGIKILSLKSDNETRWNSKFEMIARALKLRIAIDAFVANDENLDMDRLTRQDWEELQIIHDILQTFKEAVLEMQKYTKDACLFDQLPIVDYLLSFLESTSESLKSPSLKASTKMAWKLLDKYYGMMDRAPVYYAAVALDPRMKFEYFQGEWPEAWVMIAKKGVKKLWEKNFKKENNAGSLVSTPLTFVSKLEEHKFKRRKLTENMDELDIYLSTPADIHVKDVRVWWKNQEGNFPQLSKMALCLLSIPSMSADIERVFSSTKLMITDQRYSLKEDGVEAQECLKNWNKNSLINL